MSSEIIIKHEQKDINTIYERLIAAKDQPKNASDIITTDLEKSKKFQDTFCCDNPIYIEQITNIKATMPNTVIDDTVGEYLYGCFQPELSIEIACTPACADGGLKNPNLTPCDIASYEKKGELKKINNVDGEDANVFVANNNNITHDDILILRNDGVTVITIYNQDGNTINYILGESINITQDQPSPPPPQNQSQNSMNWTWIWIFIIIIIIVIIIVLLINKI